MIAVFDYGVGNLTSIVNMIKKAGGDARICKDGNDLLRASKIVLPGMGHFDNCMRKFNESGLRDLIEEQVLEMKVPLIGICVGLQMFFERSEEGQEKGLGWIKGNVQRFNEKEFRERLTVPNIGWLDIQQEKPSPVNEGLEESRFYFAHSYHVVPEDKTDVLFSSYYGYEFTAAIQRDNIIGVQFHPEKSHRFGLKLLKNFAVNY